MKNPWYVAMLVLLVGAAGLAGMVGLAQLVPYARNHANPPVLADAPWPSAEARGLAVRACYDCHSNETVWPWYSNVAPMSWLVYRDVVEGREKLIFSEWNRPQEEADELAESVREGEMPPRIYLPTHPEARLNGSEEALLVQALDQLAGTMVGGDGEDEDD